MTFLKTSVLSGVATILSMLMGFVLNKVLAVYIGPAGFGIIGQFQSFLSILQLWATGGVTTGTVKYTAEFRDDTVQKHAFWSMAVRISLVLTTVCSTFTYVFSDELSSLVLKNTGYAYVFELLAFVIFFFVFNQFLLSVLNGQKEIKRLLLINIITSVVKLGLVGWLAAAYGVQGALRGLVLVQLVMCVASLVLVFRLDWFNWRAFAGAYDSQKVKLLLGFTLMAVVGGITAPISQLLVRDYIGESLSWAAAGQVQGLWTISDAYLAVLSSVLAIYFLPRLSEIKSGSLLRHEVFSALKIVLPVLLVSSLIVIVLSKEVVLVMFTEEFLPIVDLFLWQFVGNIMKGTAFLFSFIMLAKAMIKMFIATQIIFSSSFVLLSIICVDESGLVGVAQAYAINYTIYFVVVLGVFMHKTYKARL